jgi:hypothetical protein
MLRSLDPATLAALQTLVTGIGGIFLAALWGFWDRRNRDKKEAKEGVAGERQALSKDLNDFIDGLQKDRDYHSSQADMHRQLKDQCYYDRDNVWEAWRVFSQVAHDVRHEAIRVIYRLSLRHNFDAKEAEYKIPELPNIQDIYHEAKRRKDENNAKGS